MSDGPHRDSPPPDPSRRVFFRHLGRNAVQAAGNVAGTADLIRRGSVAAAGGLLGITGSDARVESPMPSPGPAAAAAGPTSPAPWASLYAASASVAPVERLRSAYRNPYRIAGDELLIIDQRESPGSLTDIACGDAREVARAIRERAVEGAAVAGQVAAYALAMTAWATRELPLATRDALVRQAARELTAARPSARPLEHAVERMLAQWSAVGNDAGAIDDVTILAPPARTADGSVAADVMRREADAIATDAMLDHASVARLVAAALPAPADRPIGLLLHGSTGSLAGGQVGTALGAVAVLAGEARPVRVWVMESRPGLEGARLAAWELDHMDAPFTVIADAAAGWVLANEPIDAVLVGAERIARNGDVANTIGTLPLAATARALAIPLWVCAPSSAIDPGASDGAWPWAREGAPSRRADPRFDVTPVQLVSALFTESGRVQPVTEERVTAAYDRRARRRLPRGREPSSATRHMQAPPEPAA